VASTAREAGFVVRFRGVVSAKRYQKFTAFLEGLSKVAIKNIDKVL
jgi:hypothetical protein